MNTERGKLHNQYKLIDQSLALEAPAKITQGTNEGKPSSDRHENHEEKTLMIIMIHLSPRSVSACRQFNQGAIEYSS